MIGHMIGHMIAHVIGHMNMERVRSVQIAVGGRDRVGVRSEVGPDRCGEP